MAVYLMWSLKRLVNAICDRLTNKFDVFMVIEGKRGLGKCQIKGDKVLMHDGIWKNIENVKIGDKVISPQLDENYKICDVINIHSRMEEDIYEIREVTRDRKLLYTCAGNHEIPLLKSANSRRIKGDWEKRENGGIKRLTLTAKELSERYTKMSHYVSCSSPAVDFGNKNPDIDAYSLGAWLGDGHFAGDLGITTKDQEIINHIKKKYAGDFLKEFRKKDTLASTFRFSTLGKFAKQLIRYNLRYKKSGTKFIPKEILLSPIKYRLNLLAGLIDTDGYVMKKKDNHISITTKSNKLANNINSLVFSLGGHAKIKKVKKSCQNGFIGEYNCVTISFPNPNIIPLKTWKRKRIGNEKCHNPRHIAVESKKVDGSQKVYGIEIDSKSKWYITNEWMITHNSTLGFKLMLLVKREMKKRGVDGYKFIPRRDLLYERKEVLRYFHKRNHSGLADEMINVSFNRDFYNEEQKDLVKMINMNRDHNNFFIACVPQFKVLDSQIKNLCSMKITVVRRGISIIHMPNRVVYSADIWDERVNEKIERAWLKGGVSNPRYSRLTTFRGFLKFPKLTDKQDEVYQRIKDEKRNVIAQGKGIEEDDEKDPFSIIYDALIEGKIKNTAMLEGMIIAFDLNIDNTKSKIRRELKLNNKPTKIKVYYFDDKETQEEMKKERTVGELNSLIKQVRENTK